MICEQGDVIQLDFEPSVGHEPNKSRPALVVSASAFNLRSSLTAVCPVTSPDNGYPMHVPIDAEEAAGFVCVEALRTVDLAHRRCRRIGVADAKTMDVVLEYVGAMFGI